MAKFDYLNAAIWEAAIDEFYGLNATPDAGYDEYDTAYEKVEKDLEGFLNSTFIRQTISTAGVSMTNGIIDEKKATTAQLVNSIRGDMANQLKNDLYEVMDYVDEDLVIINYNLVCSPLCRGAQNKVYSKSGKSRGYPKLDDFQFSEQGWKPGKALFHPWCKHWVAIYYPGESDPPFSPEPPLDKQEEYYNETERLKYLNKQKETYRQRQNKSDAMGDKKAKQDAKKKEEQADNKIRQEGNKLPPKPKPKPKPKPTNKKKYNVTESDKKRFNALPQYRKDALKDAAARTGVTPEQALLFSDDYAAMNKKNRKKGTVQGLWDFIDKNK